MEPLQIRVYLEDTDAGGIVYHASYLKFMERARTEYLRSVGLEQVRTFKLDVSFVVYAMQLEFRRPAELDTLLEVTCTVNSAKGARVEFTQEVRDAHTQVVYCRASVSVVCITLTSKKPRRLPENVLSAFGFGPAGASAATNEPQR